MLNLISGIPSANKRSCQIVLAKEEICWPAKEENSHFVQFDFGDSSSKGKNNQRKCTISPRVTSPNCEPIILNKTEMIDMVKAWSDVVKESLHSERQGDEVKGQSSQALVSSFVSFIVDCNS